MRVRLLPEEGALNPAWAAPEAREALAQAWARRPLVRLEGVLAPGLAAELEAELRALPLAPRLYTPWQDLSWGAELGLPEGMDPQHPECLRRLPRLVREELPALLGALLGRRVVAGEPQRVQVGSLRKGSYTEAGAPLASPGGADWVLQLCAGDWPEGWGGHTRYTTAEGELLRLPPAFDTLDVYAGARFEVPLLTRPVQTLTLRGHVEPAP